MSIYNPPRNLLTIFNPEEFNIDETALTIALADTRYLKLSGGTLSGSTTFSNGLTSTNPIKLSNGTEALPSYTFSSDTNTGIYRIGTDNLGISCNATKQIDISTSSTIFTNPIVIPSLQITTSPTTGYILTSDSFGNATWQVNSSVYSGFADGTNSSPSLYFSSDTNTGVYRIGTDNIGITCGGVKQIDISNSTTAFTNSISATSLSLSAQPQFFVSTNLASGTMTALTSYILQGSGGSSFAIFDTPSINTGYTSWNASTGLLTIATAGWYLSTLNVYFENVQTTLGGYVQISLVNNNSSVIYANQRISTGASITRMNITFSGYLSAGDSIRCSVVSNYTTGAINVALTSPTTFSVVKLF